MYEKNLDGDLAIKAILESDEIISGLAPEPSPATASFHYTHESNSSHMEKTKSKAIKIESSARLSSASPLQNSLPAVRDPNTGKMVIPPNPNSKRQQRAKKLNVIKNKKEKGLK